MAVPDFKSVDLQQVRAALDAANDTDSPTGATQADEIVHDNNRVAAEPVLLTIASPYFKDDPSGWITRLAQSPVAAQCEVVVVDDGSELADVDSRVKGAIDTWPGPARQIRLTANRGRATARNRAIRHAKGSFILFLDADMMPGDDQYLSRYLELIARGDVDVAFGGFTTRGATVTAKTRLHQNLAEHSDCKPASERSARGALAVASNNLLGRRVIFEQIRFDTSYVGWGWEDTEWALQVVEKGHRLVHLDNPAIHTGLDTDEAVLRKFKEAAANLRHLLDQHPQAAAMAGARVARVLSRLPGHALLRPLAHWVACDPSGLLPMVVRRMAAKIWRASWAADALRR
jgi:hypothetical protein